MGSSKKANYHQPSSRHSQPSCSPQSKPLSSSEWLPLLSQSLGIKEAGSLTAPPASAPRLLRFPRSSAPVTPCSSSTTATPCSVRRASPVTPPLLVPVRETPAEPPRMVLDTSEWRLSIKY